MSQLKIERVETHLTQPAGPHRRLIVVKVLTSEPGLHGLGCATFTQRHRAVEAALEKHLAPLVIGRDPRAIEDLWHVMTVSGYWRNGPVLHNAVSGIDMALWDLKGKLAGLPCHELWGGRSRPAATVYVHTGGNTPAEVADRVRAKVEQGFTHVRCQLGGYGSPPESMPNVPPGYPPGAYFDPRRKLREIVGLFRHLRGELGDDVELLYDVHERLAPIDAVQLAKGLEPFGLFFLEDLLAPEDLDWLGTVRAQAATPLAIGELFCNPREYVPPIAGRLIDFIRVHLSDIGGVTPAIKLAHLAEAFGVRTAWHGPGDVSPVGLAAAVHLDVTMHNFGIQEYGERTDLEREMFPGTPELRDGALWPNDRPGWGIEFDTALAGKYPCDDEELPWTEARLPDGTLWRP